MFRSETDVGRRWRGSTILVGPPILSPSGSHSFPVRYPPVTAPTSLPPPSRPPESADPEHSSVEKMGRPSFVWLVPIVAVGLGAYLGYSSLSRRGPEITIRFKTAEGLVAQQTLVKYKAVPIPCARRRRSSPGRTTFPRRKRRAR